MNRSHSPRLARPAVYRSAVDLWLAAMLLMAPAAAAVLGIYLLFSGRHGDAMLFFILAAVSLLVTAVFTVPCRYTILHDALSVRCGIICYQIPLDQIENIESSKTLLSGPALSLRRVLVTTNKRKHVLSPRERDEFIQDLREAVASTKRQ